MSSPPPLLGPSVLQHLRTSLLLVDYLWTSVHQPQSLRISARVRQGEIWSLTQTHYKCIVRFGRFTVGRCWSLLGTGLTVLSCHVAVSLCCCRCVALAVSLCHCRYVALALTVLLCCCGHCDSILLYIVIHARQSYITF
ncbi:hypothetical protein EV363DRAFT_1198156 [Boletus edulis]|nr:hypothetical protein EV363DRAFT_1198156 [Boletus edulis]